MHRVKIMPALSKLCRWIDLRVPLNCPRFYGIAYLSTVLRDRWSFRSKLSLICSVYLNCYGGSNIGFVKWISGLLTRTRSLTWVRSLNSNVVGLRARAGSHSYISDFKEVLNCRKKEQRFARHIIMSTDPIDSFRCQWSNRVLYRCQ